MARDILLVDDDALMRRSLAFHLEQAGYHVRTAANAEDALLTVSQAPPDLVVLDINLPGMDGLEALRELKRAGDLPVIFLTARRRELDEVVGLEMGADDYVTKPFDVDVLLAHIKTVLRRATSGQGTEASVGPLVVGEIVIDPESHTVTRSGRQVELSPREFDLLLALARRVDKVVATNDLLAQVWGAEFEGQPQVVYVHIRWLRQKLEEDPNHPRLILTVRGVGYKLVAPANGTA
ncbi:MAG TPA: response regulator transcription factor [Anaerolineales bacterium]|nr:response regulator transcription factor [Anaerolineales bacterium]